MSSSLLPCRGFSPLLLAAFLLLCGGALLRLPSASPEATEMFSMPDAVTKEVFSPDGKWRGVLVYRSETDGNPAQTLFTLCPNQEDPPRNADGAILSTVYAGKPGTEIQTAEWRNARTVLLSLRRVHDPLPPDRVLARFRGITVLGRISDL